MAIDNPPIYSGITYNSLFFTEDVGGLTQTQANALYLRKTVADTASAVETFSAGVKTNLIDPTASGGTLQIGHGATNSNVEVAAQASRSVVLHVGDGDNTSGAVHIQNGNDTTGNVAVLNGAYTGNSGNLNIMTSATYPVTYTGGNVNIQTGGSRGITTIGNSLSGFNVACPMKVNIINPNTSTTLQLGVGSASTNVSLGTQVDRTGDIKIGSNALSSASSTGTLELGNVQFGSGQVSIADGFGQTANVVIGGGNAVVTGSNKIVIGKSGKTNTISGNTTLDTGTLNLSNGTINVNSPLTTGYSSSAITSSSMIGFTAIETITTTTFTSGAFTDAFTPVTLPAGVWLVYYSLRFVSSGTSTLGDVYTFSNSGSTNPILQIVGSQLGGVITASGIAFTGTFVVSSTGSTTYSVQFVCNFTGSVVTLQSGTSYSSSIRRVRIA